MSGKATPTPQRPAPKISIPDLPCNGSYSGFFDIFKTPEEIAHRDADYCEAHARFLRARGAQTDALHDLITARTRVARVMVELAALPEVCRREQEHKLRMLTLKNEAEATEAAIILAEARNRFAQAAAGKPQVTAPATDSSLSLDEVEELLQTLPEIAPETLQTLSLMLKGRMKEKRG